MLGRITQKSSNQLENQGDKSLEKGQTGDTSLFSQFSEILDKIATSLNHAKQKQDDQSLNDLATSLSQAAAQQMAQQPQRPLPVDRKPVAATSERTIEAVSREAAPVTESEGNQDVVAKANADAVTTAHKDAAQQEQSDSVPARDGGANSEKSADTTETVSAAAPSTESTDSADVQAAVTQVAEAIAVVEGQAQTTTQTEEVSVEVVAEQVQAAAPKGEVTKPANQEIAPDSLQENLAVETSEGGAPQKIGSEQVSVDVQAEEHAQSQETKSASSESSVRIAEPTASDFVSEQPAIAKADQDNEIDARQMLLQSAQALINQALLLSPSKQQLEAGFSQKLMSATQLTQSITQTGTTGQSVASPLIQNKGSQNTPEKSNARELSRPAALRTMERVESALKEVARSKDGKTISLRLDPPSLGSVKIDVTLKDGQLHARFVAESPQVNALLRDQSHELQQMLRRAGVQAERVTISIAGETPIDLNQNFQSFDQRSTQQFSESSRIGGGFGAGVDGLSEGASASVVTAQPVDHWVA